MAKSRKPLPSFDNNRDLLDSKRLDVLRGQFQMIVKNIKKFGVENNPYELRDTKDKQAIKDYIRAIAIIACEELLDEKGNLKNTNSDDPSLDSHKTICGYISGVNICINDTSRLFMLANTDACLAFNSYLNSNYSRWTKNFLQEKYHPKSTETAAFWVKAATVGGVVAFSLFKVCELVAKNEGPATTAVKGLNRF